MNTLLKTLLLSSLVGLSAPAFAHENHSHEAAASIQSETITISGAYARASAKGAPVGGAYLSISNTGAEEDRLISLTSSVAKKLEIHETSEKDGIMQMRQLENGLALPAGETVALKPGGAHLMLMGLTQQLIAGESFEMILTFEKAGDISVPFEVRANNGKAPTKDACPHADTAAEPDHAGHSDDTGHAHRH